MSNKLNLEIELIKELENLHDNCVNSNNLLNIQDLKIKKINNQINKIDNQISSSRKYLNKIENTFSKINSSKLSYTHQYNSDDNINMIPSSRLFNKNESLLQKIDSIFDIVNNNNETLKNQNQILNKNELHLDTHNNNMDKNLKKIKKIIK